MSCPASRVCYCTCPLDSVWSNGSVHVYTQSRLVAHGKMLMHVSRPAFMFPKHKMLMTINTVTLQRWSDDPYLTMTIRGVADVQWGAYGGMFGMGLGRVRAIQRWWRAIVLERWQKRALAVAMGTHPRLGDKCCIKAVDGDLLREMIAAFD